jgi:hypothetical protein
MTVITWLGCDLVTGRIVEELPDLTAQGPISHRLSAYTSASFALPIPLGGHGAPPKDWLGATQSGRCMLVAVMADQPIWAGIILPREGGTEATADFGAVTLEGYLERRYVANHTWVGQDEASVIMAGLIGDANTTEGIGLTIDAPATGTLRDRLYLDVEDKTVYEAARELSGVIDGPEWTIALGWTDATQTAVSKTFRVRKRIGFKSMTPTAVRPTGNTVAVFATQAESETRYRYLEDYSTGKGANHIVAVSSGEGGLRPASAPARDAATFAAGWPRYEYRFTPSTSITSIPVLDAHAQKALGILARGVNLLTITARADATPRLGTDWSTGDDIGYELVGHRHPAGLTGVARAIGWNLDPQAGTVSPILLTPGVDDQ